MHLVLLDQLFLELLLEALVVLNDEALVLLHVLWQGLIIALRVFHVLDLISFVLVASLSFAA